MKFAVTMVDVEGSLMREIADPRMTRDDVALSYAFGLREQEAVDWPKVNKAIIERWSRAALTYIKTKAWNLHTAPRECDHVFQHDPRSDDFGVCSKCGAEEA